MTHLALRSRAPSGGESDMTRGRKDAKGLCFNPRLPGGRRQFAVSAPQNIPAFQSTPSGRKATGHLRPRTSRRRFQSTPSGRKATRDETTITIVESFNPRLPGGRRPPAYSAASDAAMFQSTPSGRKATVGQLRSNLIPRGFNPRLPGGRRRAPGVFHRGCRGFNPRLPGGRRLPTRTIPRLPKSFNPRLPGGRRRPRHGRTRAAPPFQSTPSGRKATRAGGLCMQ